MMFFCDGSEEGIGESSVLKWLENSGTNSIVITSSTGYTYENYARDAVAVSDIISEKYKCYAPVSFSGWSAGGGTAIKTFIEYTSTHPEMKGQPCIYWFDSVSDLISTPEERRKVLLGDDGSGVGYEMFKKYNPILYNFRSET